MNVGDVVTFNYTGNVQTFTVPNTGIYKMECWGGGSTEGTYDVPYTSYGGYASGYKLLKKDTVLYICVGQRGVIGGGYNGGGSGAWYHDAVYAYFVCSGGGGATHIALVAGLLTSIGETEFVTNEKGFLIAGGAGGCETYEHATGYDARSKGGDGGTGGGNNTFGYGGSAWNDESSGWHGCGGGSGYRGGVAVNGRYGNTGGGGQGGTNWTGGVPSFVYKDETYAPVSSAGVYNGVSLDGLAKITLVKKSSVKYGDLDVDVYYGDKEVTIYYEDKIL